MKTGQKYQELGEVCNVINGLWTGKKEPFVNIAVIRNTNFSKDCRLKLDDVAYIDVESKQFKTRKLEVGDIIIEKSGGSEKQPVGRAVLFDIPDGDFSFSNFTATLRVKDKSSTSPRFLHKCLYAHYHNGETLKMQSKTTGLHNLDMKAYLKMPVPILSLAEQNRIVAELDLLTAIIDKQKAQLKELDNLAQSIFYDMFGNPVENEKGWKTKRLGDLCMVERGGSPRPIEQYLTDDKDGINWIKIGDATDGGMIISSTKQRIKPEGAKKSRFVHKGDFLLSNSMSFGKPYILGVDGCIHDGWLVIRDENKVFDTIYLYYYLGSPQTYEAFKNLAVGGVVNNLNKDLVKQVKVAIPPIETQESFAKKIQSIESQKASINRSIEESQKLFDFTMDKYFG